MILHVCDICGRVSKNHQQAFEMAHWLRQRLAIMLEIGKRPLGGYDPNLSRETDRASKLEIICKRCEIGLSSVFADTVRGLWGEHQADKDRRIDEYQSESD